MNPHPEIDTGGKGKERFPEAGSVPQQEKFHQSKKYEKNKGKLEKFAFVRGMVGAPHPGGPSRMYCFGGFSLFFAKNWPKLLKFYPK